MKRPNAPWEGCRCKGKTSQKLLVSECTFGGEIVTQHAPNCHILFTSTQHSHRLIAQSMGTDRMSARGYFQDEIFSEIDEPLDFSKTLINGSVLNVVSMNNVSFLQKSLFKKLSIFEVIYFVCNSKENKTLIFHICCILQKTFCFKIDGEILKYDFLQYCI